MHSKYLSRIALLTGMAALVLTPTLSHGAVLMAERFGYPDGTTLTLSTPPAVDPLTGWSEHSNQGLKVIQTLNAQCKLEQSTGSGQDISKLFPAQLNNAKTYAAFDLTVPSAGPGGITFFGGSDYFAHFRTSSNFNFRARTYCGPPAGATGYRLFISATSSGTSPPVPFPTDLAFDTKYHVVVAYDAATGTSTLWVDPASEASTNVTSTHATAVGEPVDSWALRQGSGTTCFQHVDNLIVANTFAELDTPLTEVPAVSPWMIALLAAVMLGAGAFVVRRRVMA